MTVISVSPSRTGIKVSMEAALSLGNLTAVEMELLSKRLVKARSKKLLCDEAYAKRPTLHTDIPKGPMPVQHAVMYPSGETDYELYECLGIRYNQWRFVLYMPSFPGVADGGMQVPLRVG